MDSATSQRSGIKMLGKSDTSYAGRAVYGWRWNLWSSCLYPFCCEKFIFFIFILKILKFNFLGEQTTSTFWTYFRQHLTILDISLSLISYVYLVYNHFPFLVFSVFLSGKIFMFKRAVLKTLVIEINYDWYWILVLMLSKAKINSHFLDCRKI